MERGFVTRLSATEGIEDPNMEPQGLISGLQTHAPY